MSPKARAAIALLARVIVGCILIYAGASKASAPAAEFELVIESYQLLPPGAALSAAGLMPWAELLVGWALLLGVERRIATAAAGAMTGVFLFALGSVLARGISLPNCGCFGEGLHFSPAHAFAFDSILALLCWSAWRWGDDTLSLDAWRAAGRRR